VACRLVTRIVVCRAYRARVAIAERNSGPAGDRLTVETGIGEADKDVPPVVKQRTEPRREPATRKIVRRMAASALLVLHLVENIFSVAPVAIELTKTPPFLQRTR